MFLISGLNTHGSFWIFYENLSRIWTVNNSVGNNDIFGETTNIILHLIDISLIEKALAHFIVCKNVKARQIKLGLFSSNYNYKASTCLLYMFVNYTW